MDNSWDIPEHTFEALKRYVEDRIPPGGFLYAVMTNNLFEALGKADNQNILKLKDITGYIYNELPSQCWGSKEKVKGWLLDKGSVAYKRAMTKQRKDEGYE